ncbi:hypothetical protein [Blastopirellula marina]|uniref:Uncharacterized protein n=1 Tax=Blastopirellula marina TaxID=124 RepID=A0A2S8GP01_9BACT|nr:hypothetical protein [Blastopirellula marina]PQO46173.1 hypothetical protein C5Y93_09285 [Blastopirellula marina]
MNGDEQPESSSLPSAQPSRPPNLSGDALKQWYLDNPPLTEEDRQRAIKRERDNQEATAWVWLMSLGMLVALSHGLIYEMPIAVVTGPATACVIGVWLAIGRSNLMVRSLIALALVASMGWAFAPYRSILMACVLCSAAASYGALWLMTWFFRTGTRRLRFTILDIGGAVLLTGCGLGMIQADMYDRLTNLQWRQLQSGLEIAVWLIGNSVLASLPVMVPKRDRTIKMFRRSAIWVVLLMPIIEGLIWFCVMSTFLPPYYSLLGAILNLVVIHLIAAAYVWALVFPLETVGAFRDEEDPPSTATEANAGHWEEME